MGLLQPWRWAMRTNPSGVNRGNLQQPAGSSRHRTPATQATQRARSCGSAYGSWGRLLPDLAERNERLAASTLSGGRQFHRAGVVRHYIVIVDAEPGRLEMSAWSRFGDHPPRHHLPLAIKNPVYGHIGSGSNCFYHSAHPFLLSRMGGLFTKRRGIGQIVPRVPPAPRDAAKAWLRGAAEGCLGPTRGCLTRNTQAHAGRLEPSIRA